MRVEEDLEELSTRVMKLENEIVHMVEHGFQGCVCPYCGGALISQVQRGGWFHRKVVDGPYPCNSSHKCILVNVCFAGNWRM